MSTRAPPVLAAALGQLRYRFVLAVIAFGLFMGWLIACIIPLCVYAAYFDEGAAISEPFRWALTRSILLIPIALTYRCRGWIVRKALEDMPPEPVKIWTSKDVGGAGLALIQLVLGLVGSVIILIVVALLGYGAYLLLATLSVPAAVVIAAIIIALAVLFSTSN